MISLLADENFDGRIFDALRQRFPSIDIVRVQDTEIYQAPDAIVLEWAANVGRIVLTHDVNTLTGEAYRRVDRGLPMPGVIEVHQDAPIGPAIADLEIMIGATNPEEFVDQVKFIPIR